MAVVRIHIDIRIDDVPVRGFPLTKLIAADEVQEFDYEEPADGAATIFSTLPVDEIDTVQVLLVHAIDAIGQRLEGGEIGDTAVRLTAGGGMIIWGASLDNADLTVNVNAPDAARLRGFAAGT